MKPNLLSTLLFIAAVGIAIAVFCSHSEPGRPNQIIREYYQVELNNRAYGVDMYDLVRVTEYAHGERRKVITTATLDSAIWCKEQRELAKALNEEWSK